MRKLFIVLLFSISIPISFSQTDSIAIQNLKNFVVNIQAFNRLYPQEKVWLHFDNTGYYLDETIWFKAYCVAATQHLSDAQSQVLYVELLNPLGKVLETKKLKIENGQCHGEFQLTNFNYEYCAGFYEIRAYTKWMLNFGEETVFSRVFPVFNPPQKEGDYASADMRNIHEAEGIYPTVFRKKPKKQKNINLDFFPEGGNLVRNLTSVVAFKATDENGKGVEITGKIVNPQGQSISEFASFHNGMGEFAYTPDGARNIVKIEYNNREYTFDFPRNMEQGYVLSVDNSQNSELFPLKISRSSTLAPAILGISVICRGEILYFKAFKTTENITTVNVPKNIFRAGVNQITMFDSKGEILAERMIFAEIPENEKVTLSIKPNKERYSSRERITLNIQSNRQVNFSLAVRDAATTIQTTENGNILTGLLLSSDIKGFIENPEFYFDTQQANRVKALDLLMLVQGWRRYEWQSMAETKPAKFPFDMEKGLKIKGNIVGKADKLHFWLERNDRYISDSVKVDASGNFSAYLENFENTWNLSMRVDGLANSNRNIRLDRWFSPTPKTYFPLETVLYKIEDNYLSGRNRNRNTDSNKRIEIINDTLQYTFDLSTVKVSAKKYKNFIYDVERDYESWIDLGKWRSYGGRRNEYRVCNYLEEKNNGLVVAPYYILGVNYGLDEKDGSPPDHVLRFGNYGISWRSSGLI
jgi:hypothetical protein